MALGCVNIMVRLGSVAQYVVLALKRRSGLREVDNMFT